MRRPTVAALLIASTLFAPQRAHAAPPPVARHTSSNGLEVLVVENHSLPLVTIEIAVKNGSMTESPEYNGLSHLYEHMFFKANAVLKSQEAYLARARELGMVWNGTTNTERVNYFFTTTTDHFADAMVFMRDAIVSPLFDAKELERERVVVTGEIDRNEANPGYHLFHEVEKRVFWKFPSYKDPLGNRKTVLSATTEKLRTIQRIYYVPNNSALVVTGDVQPNDVFARVDSLYMGWKRADDPFVKHPLVRHPALKGTEVVLVEQPVETFSGMLEWHGPSTVGPSVADTYPADVLSYAIGEPSSRFQKALVDSGVCVRVGLSWYTQMNLGPITLSFEAAPDRVDDCVRAVIAESQKLGDPGYVTEPELANAAHRLEVDLTLEREKPSSYAHTLSFWWTSAGLEYFFSYVANAKKVRPADVTRYVTTYIKGKPFVLGAMVSPQMTKRGLDRAHFEALAGIGKAK